MKENKTWNANKIMSHNFKPQEKSIFGRTGKLFKLAVSLSSQEVLKRIQNSISNKESPITLKQIEKLVEELGHMKGAAMKFGQMLSIEARDFFPEEICLILDKLQSNASSLDFNLIESILKSELKENFYELTQISKTPLAAASIGQVHGAKLNDGTELAIKVQYPGIQQSIHSDVKILSGVIKTAAFLFKKQVDINGLIDEFSDIFIQETDYIRESYYTKIYKEKATELEHIIVPTVFTNYSSKIVLTTEYINGLKLTQLIQSNELTSALREHYAKTILDLYTHEFCDWGLVQTDPNLGNFLFQTKEEKIALLDFGATKEFSLEFRILYSRLVMAIMSNKYENIIAIAEEMSLIDPRENKAAKEIFKALVVESMKPIVLDNFDFSDNHYPQNIRTLSRNLVSALKFSPPPKDLIFLHRKLSGVFQILRLLKVKLSLKKYTQKYENLASS